MEAQNFIKKPIVLLTLLILFFYLLFPYFSMSLGSFGSVSKTGMGLFFTIFDRFNFLNLLLIIIPIACGNILYQTWVQKDSFVQISKIVIVVILGYLFLHIAFLAEKSSIKFVGVGLWLSLIVSIAMFFETKINQIICPPKNNDSNPME